MTAPVVVAAAVIERDGRFLVGRRMAGTHLAGLWEFPGGKCEPGESYAECLERELLEELDVRVRVGPLVLSVGHAYPEKTVQLHFHRCEIDGEPRPLLGQQLHWASAEDLRGLRFPEADAALIALLAGTQSG